MKIYKDEIQEVLNFALENYIKAGKSFMINIENQTEMLFQILSNNLIENKQNQALGFGFHLAFDASFEENLLYRKRFEQAVFATQFELHNLDEVPVYQINLERDVAIILDLIEQIITTVYQETLGNIELEHFEI